MRTAPTNHVIPQKNYMIGTFLSIRSRVEGWRGKSVSNPRLVKRSMQFSRTTLTYMLRTKVYVAYRAGIAFAEDSFGLRT